MTADPRRREIAGLLTWIYAAHKAKDYDRRNELMRRHDDLVMDIYKRDNAAQHQEPTKEKP